mmetsp:Transcript_25401/g.56004  ORF Transcript_25401/g.56004 Transcript_25401/m.56004 type:complete len:474 (-) Transcript_25401:374-1795(-)
MPVSWASPASPAQPPAAAWGVSSGDSRSSSGSSRIIPPLRRSGDSPAARGDSTSGSAPGEAPLQVVPFFNLAPALFLDGVLVDFFIGLSSATSMGSGAGRAFGWTSSAGASTFTSGYFLPSLFRASDKSCSCLTRRSMPGARGDCASGALEFSALRAWNRFKTARIVGACPGSASKATRIRSDAAATTALDLAIGRSSLSQGLALSAPERQAVSRCVEARSASVCTSASLLSVAPRTAISLATFAASSACCFATSFSSPSRNSFSCSSNFSCLLRMTLLGVKSGSSVPSMPGMRPSDRILTSASSRPLVARDSRARRVCAMRPWLFRFAVPLTSCSFSMACISLTLLRIWSNTTFLGFRSVSAWSRRSFSICMVSDRWCRDVVWAWMFSRSARRVASASFASLSLMAWSAATSFETCSTAFLATPRTPCPCSLAPESSFFSFSSEDLRRLSALSLAASTAAVSSSTSCLSAWA